MDAIARGVVVLYCFQKLLKKHSRKNVDSISDGLRVLDKKTEYTLFNGKLSSGATFFEINVKKAFGSSFYPYLWFYWVFFLKQQGSALGGPASTTKVS